MKVSLLICAFGSFLPLCFAGDTLDYAKDVLPIMKEHCWKCHSKQHEVKGSLALDDQDGVPEDQIGKYNIIRRILNRIHVRESQKIGRRRYRLPWRRGSTL